MRDLRRCTNLRFGEGGAAMRRCGVPAAHWVGDPSVQGSVHPYCAGCFAGVELHPHVRELTGDEVTVMEVLHS